MLKTYNTREAAEYLGLEIRTIQKQAQDRKLKSVQQKPTYVFNKGQLDNYRKKFMRPKKKKS